MKKILVVLCAVGFLSGCMTVSSAYDGATPRQAVANPDGSKTFEFLFPTSTFDGTRATQRINEYLTQYVKENGMSSYAVLSTNYSQTDIQEIRRTRYTRVAAEVQFATAGVEAEHVVPEAAGYIPTGF